MRVLDLFSGIGGFSLGLEAAGMETAAFCEINPFSRQVLNKHWPDIPIYKDIRTLSGEQIKNEVGEIDIICGGFPCQPFSRAGNQKGTEDYRDLWPEMFRVITEINPTWVICENVAGFINMAFTRTKSDLESAGYTLQPFVIPACAIGANHRRDRVWIIAHTGRKGIEGSGKKSLSRQSRVSRWENERGLKNEYQRPKVSTPRLCGTLNGLSARVDSLGNAVVPQIPEIIGRCILLTEEHFGGLK